MELAIRGTSINVLNDSGQTPLDLAILGERRLASNILASETQSSALLPVRFLKGLVRSKVRSCKHSCFLLNSLTNHSLPKH